ncbi:MAG: Uma2 family endonuclease [Emticicia sp.]|uniref:Uma2 family endonuclease n=1 Tax=Emticicia sp. TaxID=1930953 RepID=UPI003BA54523
MITSLEQLDLTKAYTFKDYLSWKFHERVELLRGYVAKMSPAPTSTHQIISGNLHFNLAYFLRKKPCRVIAAPFDVYLPSIKGEGETVVQPDLCVICDASKIKKQGCVGSPDLVIEILSLGNSRKEMTQKFQIYEQAGVKEYWVVYPYEQVIHQYILEGNTFQALPIAEKTIKSQLLQGFEVDMDTIFDTIVE